MRWAQASPRQAQFVPMDGWLLLSAVRGPDLGRAARLWAWPGWQLADFVKN
ncbi:hypothetical protein A2U01_0055933 [Trifolium medium]|uniref:Uncharacterized protein n=1 Tax=Trifolium medium TaxID=97028 RepID=A0A392RDL4_9FABA|nr:hypothetical protein [Trifolium medium]